MVKKVNTVAGPIWAADLGSVLMHEHVTFSYPGYQGDSRWWTKEHYDYCVRTAVETCREIKARGIDTVVDASTNECSRDPLFLREVSETAEINIICCSGYYFEGAGTPGYFKNMHGMGLNPEEQMTDLYETELTKGIGDTGVKPGLLKASCSFENITDFEQMLTRTVGKLAAKYDIPIITHTFGANGGQQADLLMEQGARPEKIMIGHSCDSTDMAYLLDLAKRGVYIGYDRWGHFDKWGPEGKRPTDEVRLSTFTALISAGYADRLMCSQDCTFVWRGVGMGEIDPLLKDWVPTHFVDRIIPALKERGITDTEVNMVLKENPRRFFG